MYRRLKFSVIATFFVSCVGSFGLFASPPVDTPVARLENPAPQRVMGIPLEVLEKAGLRVAWVFPDLPMGRAEKLRQVFYHDGRLFAVDDRNVLYGLDGKNGTILWSTILGPAHEGCSSPGYYQGHILFMLGNTFLQIRPSDGLTTQSLELGFAVSTDAARTANRLLVGSGNNRFYSLRLSDGVPLWQAVCADEPIGRVAVDADRVYFTCSDDVLYVSGILNRSLVWKAVAAGRLCGVALDRRQCFLPSVDTVLYCFDSVTGSLLWKYLAGGSLAELPVLTENAVYQPVKDSSLLCLDRWPSEKTGQLRWELPDGAALLAENGPISYIMTLSKELTVMDNRAGRPISRFFAPQADLYVSNVEDELIFLAGHSGTFLALRPETVNRDVPSVVPAAVAPSTVTPAEVNDTEY